MRQVADLIKLDRLHRINALVNECAEERSSRYLNTVQEVLVEGVNPKVRPPPPPRLAVARGADAVRRAEEDEERRGDDDGDSRTDRLDPFGSGAAISAQPRGRCSNSERGENERALSVGFELGWV